MSELFSNVKDILSTLEVVNRGSFFTTYRVESKDRKYNVSKFTNGGYLVEDITKGKNVLERLTSNGEFIQWFNSL